MIEITNDSQAVQVILDPATAIEDRFIARRFLITMRGGCWTPAMLNQLDAQREGTTSRPSSARTHVMVF
jgi:hypothetical protein